MTQVFARYAKDLLEKQTYPEVRRAPNAPVEPPYDVTAWSLGMLFGVDVEFVAHAAARRADDARERRPRTAGPGRRQRPAFPLRLPRARHGDRDQPAAEGRSAGRRSTRRPASSVDGVGARDDGARSRRSSASTRRRRPAARRRERDSRAPLRRFARPRIGLYSPWTGGNIDEGWTRWVLEQYEFEPRPIHNDDIRGGGLRQRFDAIILPDQTPREIIDGFNAEHDPARVPRRHRRRRRRQPRAVRRGGRHARSRSAPRRISRSIGFRFPVRNLKRGLRREQHFAPGTILRIQVDTHAAGRLRDGGRHATASTTTARSSR